ncbi:MAG: hypothetical protein IH598_03875 [Bacteroidales bacterium]|nr:hypothetical protein [Bacteroidales bacterium]
MENLFNNQGILNILWRRKIHLAILVLISIVLSVIFSSPFFITPKYKSIAILYPEIETIYSTENESEQMLQWLESRDISDSLIARFDLTTHYKMDSSDPQIVSNTYRKLQKHVFITTTKFESVKIEIWDKDPDIACQMVLAMIDLYNQKVNEAHRVRYREVLVLEEKRLLDKKKQLDSLMVCIVDMRMKYGLIDYGIQTGEVTRGYLGTFDGSATAQINRNEIKKLKSDIESKGDSLLLLTNLLTSVTHAYNNYLVSYEDALRNVSKELTFASVVTNPVPADKKCYPVRWIIVFITAASALFISAIIMIVVDSYEQTTINN